MDKNIIKAEVEIEIPFFDIDLMEIVWHGHYVKYFELARCVLLDKIDYDYIKMRESGYSWPIIDLHIRYAKPAKFGQKIRVTAELVEWKHRLKIKYQIRDQLSQTRLTRGYTSQVAVEMKTNQMCYESPRILLEKLGL